MTHTWPHISFASPVRLSKIPFKAKSALPDSSRSPLVHTSHNRPRIAPRLWLKSGLYCSPSHLLSISLNCAILKARFIIFYLKECLLFSIIKKIISRALLTPPTRRRRWMKEMYVFYLLYSKNHSLSGESTFGHWHRSSVSVRGREDEWHRLD